MTTPVIAPPQPRTAAQAEASRLNGARSAGPVTPEGKARSALNGTRHGLCSIEFFLLPDEDPQAYALFVVDLLHLLQPRSPAEHQAAERVAQARWREMRADRLEADILAELFAAKSIADEDQARAARAAGTRALNTLLRYRQRIQRDADRALLELDALRQRRRASAPLRPVAARTSEPEPAAPTATIPSAALPAVRPPARPAAAMHDDLALPRTSEPGPPLNRRQRRRLAALQRKAPVRLAA